MVHGDESSVRPFDDSKCRCTPNTVVLATTDRLGLDPFAGIGSGWYEPLSAGEVQPLYRHGTGELTVDLTQARLAGPARTVTVENAVGDVIVIVPDDAEMTMDGATALGEVTAFDRHGGLGPDRRVATSTSPRNAKSSLRLHVRTGIGSVVVYTGPLVLPPVPASPSPSPTATPQAGGGA